MTTTGVGVSHATELPVSGIPAASVSADGKFFKPGPNTIIKLNDDQAGSGGLALPSTPSPSGTTAALFLRNAKYMGQTCGTDVIQQTSGRGKTTLVLTVEKGVSTTVKKEISIDAKYISAGMGWDVTKSYTVKNETRFEVPAGKFGTVQAYPLYNMHQGDVWEGLQPSLPTGKRVYAYKPVGVCFNQWVS
ncbi:hypothetical protein [Streptomyces sp. NPDC051211]|uniref:hypothetical protein n=1 Tax=Streptomyces sp. NPDC051211 TaxID=3154643 RepID=UPI0034508533